MSVIMMCTTKVVTGKMAEYMGLEKKMWDAMKGVEGVPSSKRLMPVSGKDEMQHTIIYLTEFDSFADMDKFAATQNVPEFQALMPQFDAFIESHQHDVFMETPMP